MAEPFFMMRDNSGKAMRTQGGFLAIHRAKFPSAWFFVIELVNVKNEGSKAAFDVSLYADGKVSTAHAGAEFPQYDLLATFSGLDWYSASQTAKLEIYGSNYARGAAADIWAFGKYWGRVKLTYPDNGWELGLPARSEVLTARMERDTNEVYINGKYWGVFPQIKN